MVIGVCVGVKVVAETGLLDNKRGTTHWFVLQELRKKHPTMQYVANRRLVVDHGVATTTGITASIPMSLTLIEAIAGRDKAEAVARDLGLDEVSLALSADAWSRTYRSRAVTFADSPGAITTRSGIRIVPDATAWPKEDVVNAFTDRPPAQALDETLAGIETRYGARTRYVVAMQLE